ncbi:MAG: S-adenosylmethionine:tRNA ribosyltransferase-isomerase [Prevotellaceae bacterium]|jgi:S-adenosylmethionine:tRNA ribosyltransferase-isomerase|nr:S-adenosylmethionine:tRNA ribosyltransferase-isomerase [Prevotellaceae bacterium]
MIESINISQFDYVLPESRIASYPLLERDDSRLLVYRNGSIEDRVFKDLHSCISSGAMMVFNNTRVVPARLYFAKEGGALIEILCLEPHDPNEYSLTFEATESVVWRVAIGNKKRWKKGRIYIYNPSLLPSLSNLFLCAECIEKEDDTFLVRFLWSGGLSFATVLELCGKVPIPPYLHRASESIDIERYQTIYAAQSGSVAAPTAGLHFTQGVLSSLTKNNILFGEVTLHVGAGTFMPVKSNLISNHHIHSEPFTVSLSFLESLLHRNGDVVCVGTTSARCVESLYYFGVMCSKGIVPNFLPQWDAYTSPSELTREESLTHLITYLKKRRLTHFSARTQLMIVPSFTFKWMNGLITNFHQPKSTLLLLVAAFIGEDWQKCYQHAIDSGYRFLSYGDTSLMLPLQPINIKAITN